MPEAVSYSCNESVMLLAGDCMRLRALGVQRLEEQTAARCAQLGVQQVYSLHFPVTGVLEYMAG